MTRINLKVPDYTHHKAVVMAAKQRITLQELCLRALEKILKDGLAKGRTA